MTESEGTSPSASASSSGGSTSRGRKRKTRRRAKPAAAARPPARKRRTAATAARRKPATRRRTTARRGATRRRTAKPAGLQGFLNDLAKRASRAGSTIADLSEGGTDAARRAVGTVGVASRQTIARVKREWNRMDNTRRVEFVAGLLAALAAATAGARAVARKK